MLDGLEAEEPHQVAQERRLHTVGLEAAVAQEEADADEDKDKRRQVRDVVEAVAQDEQDALDRFRVRRAVGRTQRVERHHATSAGAARCGGSGASLSPGALVSLTKTSSRVGS